MRKINILQIIATLDIGGAERQLVELVKRLDKNKYNITVCCITRGGPLEEDLKKLGIEYYILYKKSKFDFTVIFKLIRLIRQKKIDLVHTWMFTSNAWGRIAAKLASVPVIISAELSMVDPFKGCIQKAVDKMLVECNDIIIANSEAVKKSHKKKEKIPLNKIIVIPTGIDTQEFKPRTIDIERQKKLFILKNPVPVVGIIGRLVEGKGYEYFLEAAAQVLRFATVKFVIVGKGPLRDKLEKMTDKLGISNEVLFMGYYKEVIEFFSLIDILVLPSLSEGLSGVLLEGMAMAKPVVATNIESNVHVVVNGETGILVPPKNPKALAEGIIRLLKNKEEARKMGLAGRKRVEKYFDINFAVEKTEQLYEHLLQKKSASFSFGENWLRYIETFNKENLREVRLSLQELLGVKSLKGKSFIDIGCGSGIFSLAAIDMNAQEVISLDKDPKSVEACNIIKRRNDVKHWSILQGSILDKDFINNLGRVDIIYAWGVLHHTGAMWKAIDNSAKLVRKEGLFALAIYNRHWTSGLWLGFKRFYNRRGKIIQKIMVLSVFLPRVLARLIKLKHPFSEKRGMSIYYDAVDWAGGFPYEYANFDEIVSFLEKRDFILIHEIRTKSIGCNQFVFKKI